MSFHVNHETSVEIGWILFLIDISTPFIMNLMSWFINKSCSNRKDSDWEDVGKRQVNTCPLEMRRSRININRLLLIVTSGVVFLVRAIFLSLGKFSATGLQIYLRPALLG